MLSRELLFLQNMARRICRNESDASDLVQDTCERALAQLTGAAPPAKPRAWLVTIMHHLFIDRCRKRARRPIHESLDERTLAAPGPGDPEPLWARLTIDDVMAALADLEPALREVYQLHVLERRSYAEISEVLHIERLTVGTRLFRARRRLREVLQSRSPRGETHD